MISHVPVGTLDPSRFRDAIDGDRFERFALRVAEARAMLEGRVVWNVNSTAGGGGVAEMLRSLLAYAHGAGVDARWVVIDGNPDFFRVTKRLHNHLHGALGDGGALGDAERRIYDDALAENIDELSRLVSEGDVVIVHDPQPAGLCGPLKERGALVMWRCHVGIDNPNDVARGAWNFLKPYVTPADTYVFTRRAFVWEGLDDARLTLIAPSIDAFSPKNQELSPETVDAILAAAGVVEVDSPAAPTFLREDGSPGRVDRTALMVEEARAPGAVPLVVQVSRWDRLKDPLGVIDGFARHVAPETDAHLVLGGPDVGAVADDPEGAEVLAEAVASWQRLPNDMRSRVHLACLPMQDGEENAAVVNALQRKAAVVVQKSLAEGFGLTVAEAMWKARPVVASRIGGIQDQIENGVTGVLVDDPRDLEEFGRAVSKLLQNPDAARTMGAEAQKRIRDEFLGPRHLMQYIDLIERLSTTL